MSTRTVTHYICDRCGLEYAKCTGEPQQPFLQGVVIQRENCDTDSCELCGECLAGLQKYLKFKSV